MAKAKDISSRGIQDCTLKGEIAGMSSIPSLPSSPPIPSLPFGPVQCDFRFDLFFSFSFRFPVIFSF